VRWFLTYAWRRKGETAWHLENEIITVHPVRWRAGTAKAAEEDYRVVFYERIERQEPYVEDLIEFALQENSGEIWPLEK
jgi:hypothetical protein